MRALRGGIPRALPSHLTSEAYAYRVYVQAKLQRLGSLPLDAMPTLREAGLVTIELVRVRLELEAARAKPNRRREVRRLQRVSASLRGQLLALERRLEEVGDGHRKPVSGRELLAGAGVRSANGETDR